MPDMTITFTVEQASRLKDAFATQENPTPTLGDVRREVNRFLRGQVRRRERAIAEAAIVDAPFDPV